MTSSIAVVGSDKTLINRISRSLEENLSYNIIEILKGKELLTILSDSKIKLIIIAGDITDINKFVLCQKIKENNYIPIIMLLTTDDEDAIVKSFDCGCDDCIYSPLHLRELQVRCLKMIELYAPRETSISDDIHLTATEKQLFNLFLINENKILTYDEIATIWNGQNKDNHIIATNINRLRKKIGKDKIITIRGIGYQYIN